MLRQGFSCCFPLKYPCRANLRYASTSSAELRKTFLDYFESQSHKVVPSSSVIPWNDPSLAFVNAGMNAFKGVFLGSADAPAPRVANVQKCIRVGGKHNDLDAVGLDGSHHTFFEMMGNWSFGDYFKQEACGFAWNLLTGPLEISSSRLFVTYFGGCPELGLEEDVETRDIWRSLGVARERILPFGAEDNFWEMGFAGPCGPCTEIHYDHFGTGGPKGVNAGLPDLVEIWNIVFMEYNRREKESKNGIIERLPKKHVDTGLGLERLVALKNGSLSNYDTDLFVPIFNRIASSTGRQPYGGKFQGPNHLDTAYRILADHMRMINVSLADGVFPDSSSRLRNVIRRSFRTARDFFQADLALLLDVSKEVSDILGEQYPEMHANASRISTILEFERDKIHKLELEGTKALNLLIKAYPAARNVDVLDAAQLHEGLKFLDRHYPGATTVNGDMGMKLYGNFGMKRGNIETLAAVKGLPFNGRGFDEELENTKHTSKILGSETLKLTDLSSVPKTDDQYKFGYSSPRNSHYQFPTVQAKISALYTAGSSEAQSLSEGEQGAVYITKTTFHSESGGQVGDLGELVTSSGACFSVTDCQQLHGSAQHVVHVGTMKKGQLRVGDRVKVRLDTEHRLRCMQNHTATHLLNAVLHELLPLTCQRSSFVGPSYFKFDFNTFQSDLSLDFIGLIEDRVNTFINDGNPIRREMVPFEELLKSREKLTLVPGEIYPSTVSLIRIEPDVSAEPCCGTHLLNTGDVQAFVVIGVDTPGTGVKSFRCVTGVAAMDAREAGIRLIKEVMELNEQVQEVMQDKNETPESVALANKLRRKKAKLLSEKGDVIPYIVRMEMLEVLNQLLRSVRSVNRISSKECMVTEMREVLEDRADSDFIVHSFGSEEPAEGDSECVGRETKVTLSKITKLCTDKPIFLCATSNEKGPMLSARAVIPESSVTASFSAEKWLSSVAACLPAEATWGPPRGKDGRHVCNLRVSLGDLAMAEQRKLIHATVELATNFAREETSASAGRSSHST